MRRRRAGHRVNRVAGQRVAVKGCGVRRHRVNRVAGAGRLAGGVQQGQIAGRDLRAAYKNDRRERDRERERERERERRER